MRNWTGVPNNPLGECKSLFTDDFLPKLILSPDIQIKKCEYFRALFYNLCYTCFVCLPQ